ncbi:MAG: hypothetical protein FWG46_00855 [Treponema sp.]|nr:hypothetical protein [Treponema sp.]
MKRLIFLSFFLLCLTVSLFSQVSFQYENRSFTELGLTTNEQIAQYLQIEISDLLPIFQHSSMRGQGASLSPAEFYDVISTVSNTRDFIAFGRICRELGITMERFFLVFFREMGGMPEADLQMTLAVIRIGIKWKVISQ